MIERVQQSVTTAMGSPTGAVSVSAVTIGTGISTALEVLPPILGVIASLCGIILSILLARNYVKKWKLMDAEIKLKAAQVLAISERKHERE